MNIFKIIALCAVSIGSYTDLKTYEVPDWLNYSLIALGVGGNLIFSIVFWDFTYMLRSLFGLAAALIIGLVMYYSGQWGGGDSKMLFGLGALLGLNYPLRIDFFVKFLINMLFAGALYGIIWMSVLAIKNRKKIWKKFVEKLKEKKYKNTRIISGFVSILGLAALNFIDINAEIKFVFSLTILVFYFLNYLFVLVKVVEDTSMIKQVPPEKLTEGDWIVEDIIVGKKRITGPKDLGITKKQIAHLLKLKQKGKIKKIKVKYGIPFVPSFFIAMIYTIITEKAVLFLLL